MIKLKDILKEIEELPNGKISKMEELEALQFIRKDIVPIVVDYINRRAPSHEISKDSVTKNLKKINPEYNRTRDITHCILYHSDVPRKTLDEHHLRIKFLITKHSDGKVSVLWGYPEGWTNSYRWSGAYPIGFIG